MTWRINVRLPRDRRHGGRLQLVDGTGAVRLEADCLGKADNAAAMKAGNPDRDPVKSDGDTPTGLYAPARPVPIPPTDPNFAHMGAWFIPLDGVAGDALRARQAGRHGLAIHAGRSRHPDGTLVPTNGCLRVSTEDMAALVATLAGEAVETAIDELPASA